MESCLVCYDISNPKRLRKVARCCEDYGYRKQFSVFICRISATDFVRLRSRLYDIINLEVDQVLFIPLSESGLQQMEAIGRPTDPHDSKDIVIVT